jgi:hypothetical protein
MCPPVLNRKVCMKNGMAGVSFALALDGDPLALNMSRDELPSRLTQKRTPDLKTVLVCLVSNCGMELL